MRICVIEFTNRIAASVNWTQRKVYEEGDKVVTPECNKYALMRLWWKVVSAWVISYTDWQIAYEQDDEFKTTTPAKPSKWKKGK